MKKEKFDIASGLIDRIDKLEKMIFNLQDLSKCKYFTIIGDTKNDSDIGNITINLKSNEMATEIFVDNILEYYIGILNIELQELRNDFELL